MPDTLDALVALLDLETIEVGLYRGQQPDTALQRVFGGQVLGQALAAASRTVPDDRPAAAHSLHGYFLLPGDTGVPIVYDVETIRDGRSFSTRRVVARQHGREIFYLTASFHVEEAGMEHQDAAPTAPPPEDCPSLAELYERLSGRPRGAWEREWAALDVRYAGDSRPGGALPEAGHPARARLWLRTSGPLPDDPVLHRCVLAYESDLTLLGSALVPHGVFLGQPGLQVASIDHAMWFLRPFRADDWLLYDQVSPSASGARALAAGRLFDPAGRLVASVAQEGLVRGASR